MRKSERDARLAATMAQKPELRYFVRTGLFPEEAEDRIYDLMASSLDRAHPHRQTMEASERPFLSTDSLYSNAGGGWFCDHQAFGDLLEALVRSGRIDVLRSRQPEGEPTNFIFWVREATATTQETK